MRRIIAAISGSVLTVVGVIAVGSGAAPAAAVPTGPLTSSFYRYSGSEPLARVPRGTVLKTRTVPYQIQGVPLPLEAVQLLFRTVNARGRADLGVTTVIRPQVPVSSTSKVVAYDSFYDSLSPADEPSVAVAGGTGTGDAIPNVETALFTPLLLAGYTIVDADTEGQRADFAAGPEYGEVTLDSLKAASHSAAAGIGSDSPIGLAGYSGGAIGAEWAAQQASTYAPAIARRIVGTAIGGVLVEPGHNLHYVQGSQIWAGVMPMALIGIARAYHVDLSPYMSAKGRRIMTAMKDAPIGDVLGRYPGLTWKQLAKRRYAVPESVPVYVRLANRLIMGRGQTPTAPMFIGQGTGGQLEGTQPSATYGAGDGVMLAGDVRSLAREYCSRGVPVDYQEYPTSHTSSAPLWIPQALSWLMDRFSGSTPPSSCGSIAAGNPLKPLRVVR
jgi:hypothetical protein